MSCEVCRSRGKNCAMYPYIFIFILLNEEKGGTLAQETVKPLVKPHLASLQVCHPVPKTPILYH